MEERRPLAMPRGPIGVGLRRIAPLVVLFVLVVVAMVWLRLYSSG
jgi:hypothetical protein